MFASEFAGGWLGFWTAPEVLSYGLIWSNFPGGTWEYRWGDQQFWKSALGLFDDGSHVEDVSYVRLACPVNDPCFSRGCRDPRLLKCIIAEGQSTVRQDFPTAARGRKLLSAIPCLQNLPRTNHSKQVFF